MRRRFMSASGIPDNQIWYTTNDGNIIEPILKPSVGAIAADYGFGSALVSNQYYDKGIIKTRDTITQIGTNVFKDKVSLVSIMLPKHASALNKAAFRGCTSLIQIDGVENVTTIGHSVFSGCTSLKGIKLPNALKKIPSSCFQGCSSFKEFTIGENIDNIGDYAFRDCTLLKTLYVKAISPPYCMSNSFNHSQVSKVYVPFESVSIYQETSPWNYYTIEGYNFK